MYAIVLVIGVLGAVLLLFALWQIPKWQSSRLKINDVKEKADLENEFRRTLVQLLGGIAVAAGLIFTWIGLVNSQKSIAHQIQLTRDAQLADRFTSAIEHLADTTIQQRLAGIYTLQSIATDGDSESYRRPIIRVLSGWISEIRSLDGAEMIHTVPKLGECSQEKIEGVHAARRPPAGIQAALEVIGRVSRQTGWRAFPDEGIWLEGVDLRKAVFDSTDLRRANLHSSWLQGAKFIPGTDLDSARVTNAHLEGAVLPINAKGVRFDGSALCWANLEGVTLDGATFKLVNFHGASMWNASLKEASFDGADLSGVVGLTAEQISQALISTTTKLPPHLDTLSSLRRQQGDIKSGDVPPRCIC